MIITIIISSFVRFWLHVASNQTKLNDWIECFSLFFCFRLIDVSKDFANRTKVSLTFIIIVLFNLIWNYFSFSFTHTGYLYIANQWWSWNYQVVFSGKKLSLEKKVFNVQVLPCLMNLFSFEFTYNIDWLIMNDNNDTGKCFGQ